MSNLTIVDLHQEEELSSSERAKVRGGIDCLVAMHISDNCNGLANMLEGMGYHDAALVAQNTSLGVGNGCDHGDSP